MRRREFIPMLGGAVAAWSFAVRAQQRPKLPVIGFLGASTADVWAPMVSSFEERLHELGWIAGRNVAIEYRWAEGRSDRYAEFAAEFGRLKVDVIVTSGTAVTAIQKVTPAIPIVLALASDPVGDGLVTSLAHPGGNVTGLSLQAPELAGKRLELLREIFPGVHRLAILADVGNSASMLEMGAVQEIAHTLGFDVITLEIHQEGEIVPAFKGLSSRADALYVCPDPLVRAFRLRINSLAAAARLPTIHGEEDYVEAGGLMSYGPIFSDLFKAAAEYVDKILHGAKAGDLPIEQPTRFELAINLKTAKAIGLVIPESFLLRADKVIE